MQPTAPQKNSRDPYDKPGNGEGLVDTTPSGDGSDPRTSFEARHNFPGGNSSDPRGGTPKGDGEAIGRGELKNRESSSSSGTSSTSSSSSIDREEQAFNELQSKAEARGKAFGGLYTGGDEPKTLKGRISRFGRKKLTALVITGIVGGGGIFGLSILSGPFQTIQMAQQLMKHMRLNEDFGNDRTSRVLINALRNGEKERTRLGFTGNLAADRWEKRLVAETGMRPVYQEKGGRFVGFEIIDRNKAESILGDIGEQNNRSSRKLEQSMGNGAEIKTGDNRAVRSTSGEQLTGDRRFVDLSNVSMSDRRAWIKTISNSTDTNRISSSLGSRLLIKRAGVNFHPMNKIKGELDNARERRLVEKRNNEIENGVEESKIAQASTKDDGEGNQVNDEEGQKVSDEAKDSVEEFKSKGIARMAKPTPDALLGIMCSVRQLGGAIATYKFVNNVLPMIRMGMNVVTTGSQVMSNKGFSLTNLRFINKYMYDKQKKEGWNQAASIRAEQGKSGGVAMPAEADLRDEGTTGKPKLFKVVDGIPMLGTGCKIQDAIFGLPVISTIVGGVGAITEQLADAVLSVGGLSTEELTEGALKALAGKSVDPESTGADFGNLANTGAFLAANDQAIATGGKPLTPVERANLALYEEEGEILKDSNKSFAEKYLDPYNQRSVTANVITAMPMNSTQAVATLSNPVSLIGNNISNMFASISPKAKAASQYDYGVPKYGFSLGERQNDLFDDPYENAARTNKDGQTVEQDLPRLNEKYGKCFGMTVTVDEGPQGKVHIQSADKSVNVFEISEKNYEKYPDCNPEKGDDQAEIDRYTQYRFYLADAVTAVTLACYEADDEQACGEIGAGSSGSGPSEEAAADTGDVTDSGFIKKLDNPLPGANSGGNVDVKGVTLHWWGGQYGKGIKGLTDIFKSNGLSVQLGITSEGEVYQLTKSLTTKTSHAIGGNSTTIGIEIEGGPKEFGKEGIEKYPEKFEAVVKTVKYLVQKYNIPLEKEVTCNNASGILQHKDFNKCPTADGKSDIDDYYYQKVMERVRE